jgi:hypothetical protein
MKMKKSMFMGLAIIALLAMISGVSAANPMIHHVMGGGTFVPKIYDGRISCNAQQIDTSGTATGTMDFSLRGLPEGYPNVLRVHAEVKCMQVYHDGEWTKFYGQITQSDFPSGEGYQVGDFLIFDIYDWNPDSIGFAYEEDEAVAMWYVNSPEVVMAHVAILQAGNIIVK